MLRREDAQAQLKAFAADPARAGADRAHLAGPLAARLQEFIGNPHAVPAEEIGEALDAAGPDERVRVLGSVCPPLAEALARWWVWAQAGPYQMGWARRGFRSRWPVDTRPARAWTLWSLLRLGREYPQDVAWFATWLSHVQDHSGALSGLLASEITAGRTDIADTLRASSIGQHAVSGITRSGIGALLGCDRPELWEHVADLLLGRRPPGRAPHGDPGGRRPRSPCGVPAHPRRRRRRGPHAFRRDSPGRGRLVRRGADRADRRTAHCGAGELARALADPAAPVPGTPAETFIRLTAVALHDAYRAIPVAAHLLHHPDPGVRRAAARLLAELGLVAARDALRPALADPDLTVYATAVSAWPTSPFSPDLDAHLDDAGVAVLMGRIRTLGPPRQVDTGLIGDRFREIGSAHAADVVLAHRTVTAAPAEALAAATPDGRRAAARRLAADPVANRAALFAFLADASSSVRDQVYAGLDRLPGITADEAALLHAALRRKASDLRQQALVLLQKQSPAGIALSVAALASGTKEQATAAAELASRAGLPAPDGTAPRMEVEFPALLRYRPDDRMPPCARRSRPTDTSTGSIPAVCTW